MNLYLRFLITVLTSRFRSRLTAFDVAVTPFRVALTDLDVLMHMNNGKYFSLMDLGRIDFMLRNGLWPRLKAKKWYPVVVSETMRFKRSLALFRRFEIRTRTLGWDEKYFYLEQAFYEGEKLCALALIKARFLGPAGLVAPSEVVALIGHHEPSPPLPEFVAEWVSADKKQLSRELGGDE